MTSKVRYEPATAIRQFSTGRIHVLGLADNGKIWMWHDINRHGRIMRPLHADMAESGPVSGVGRVTRVVAGKIMAQSITTFPTPRAYKAPGRLG